VKHYPGGYIQAAIRTTSRKIWASIVYFANISTSRVEEFIYKQCPSEIITFLLSYIFTSTDLNILNIVSKPLWPSPNWTRQTRVRVTTHLYLGERDNVHTRQCG